MRTSNPRYEFHALTPDRWGDLEQLFGERGACGGCWCMWWRLKRSTFNQQKGAKNKAAFKAVVEAGDVPGILAYAKADLGTQASCLLASQPERLGQSRQDACVPRGTPIGWCAVAPRETYPALERSRVLKRIDDQPVWSIVCLFIARPYRRKGVSVALVRAAADYVRKRGGRIVEGYPVEPRNDEMPDAFAWTGLASAFLKAGFVERERRSETRPIMRRIVRAR